jgi:hypothetical protein
MLIKNQVETLMLTKADDFPVHQLPEPIATSEQTGISTIVISSTATRWTAACF